MPIRRSMRDMPGQCKTLRDVCCLGLKPIKSSCSNPESPSSSLCPFFPFCDTCTTAAQTAALNCKTVAHTGIAPGLSVSGHLQQKTVVYMFWSAQHFITVCCSRWPRALWNSLAMICYIYAICRNQEVTCMLVWYTCHAGGDPATTGGYLQAKQQHQCQAFTTSAQSNSMLAKEGTFHSELAHHVKNDSKKCSATQHLDQVS